MDPQGNDKDLRDVLAWCESRGVQSMPLPGCFGQRFGRASRVVIQAFRLKSRDV
jgi:hypothetical protein